MNGCITHFLRISILFSVIFLMDGFVSLANAAQGCGHGYHRNFYGRCVFNHPGRYSTPAPRHPGCWRNARGYLRCY